MTDHPTREQLLLHLVDRARRGVALPAEHDQLAAGVSAMADALAEQRTTTVEALDASHVTLRRYRKRAERAEAANTTHRALLEEARDALEAAGINEAHGGNSWPRLVPAIEELAQRAEQAEAERDRVQQAACRTAENLRNAEQRAEQAEAAVERVRAEFDRVAALGVVRNDDSRADRFSTGARWTIRMIRGALDHPQQPSTTTA
jgi:chromosome segregation ATPase